MKCTIPEISWHNREPVFSVDIYPKNGQFYRLASGGSDCHVLIWQMSINVNGAVDQELVSDLTRHQRSVNCVRWSGSGKYLASGDDDANIIIWQLKTDNIPLLEGDNGDKEVWTVYKVLRGHKEDVYDICWSMDESKILSGSVDNTAILWDISNGKVDHILSDHKGFVQGVAWDPKNQYLATISTDRVCRIFDKNGKHVKTRIQRGKITSVPDGHFLKDKEVKYFHDDTFKSFFRRLQFTPDGSLLLVPSGFLETEGCKEPLNATLVFTLDNFSSPAMILPIPRQSSTVVRCCPVLYKLREGGPEPSIKLPYRIIFAVGTDHDIILYDTQQHLPFARFQDIHYTRLTDLAWSPDGLLLIASSTDGYCSLITFEENELGETFLQEVEEDVLNISGCEELEKDENVAVNNQNTKEEADKVKKRPSFLEQWALNTPKKKPKLVMESKKGDKENVDVVIEILDSPVKLDECSLKPESDILKDCRRIDKELNQPEPKRIKPTLLDSKPSTSHQITSDSEEELCLEEQQDYATASQCIKEFFNKKPDRTTAQTTDAHPIALRRKPAEKSEARPIEVRRTPRMESKVTPKKTENVVKVKSVEKPKNALLSFLQKAENKVQPVIDEDTTEEFCLRLDESPDHKEESKTTENCKSTSEVKECQTPKTPRRVPFITLSSPGLKPKKL